MTIISEFKKKQVTLSFALSLLSKASKIRLFLISFTQILLGFLDLVGVLLIGATVSLVVRGLTSSETGNRVNYLFEVLGLSRASYETKLVTLLLGAFLLLIGKTILAFQLQKRILRLLSNQSAEASVSLLGSFFSSPLSFIEQRNKQQIIYSLTTGVSHLIRSYIGSLSAVMIDLMLLLTLLFGLCFISPLATICLALFYLSVMIVLNQKTHKDVRKLSRAGAEIGIELNQKVSEFIGAYRELVVRNGLADFARSIGGLRYRSASLEADLQFKSILGKYVFEIAMLCSLLFLFQFQRINGSFADSAASTAVFIAATTRIVPAVVRIQQGIINLNSAASASAPTLIVIGELREIAHNTSYRGETEPSTQNFENFPQSHLAIEVKNVTFCYSSKKTPAIKSASFQVEVGQKVGVVGRTGSGKSTLLDIVLGIHEPDAGEVRIMDKKPEELFKVCPNYVSYVPQRSFFTFGSVKENLLLGIKDPSFSDKELISLLSLVNLHNNSSSRKLELDELILENASNLSGGQRQALGIARALLVSPKLLILDEATSAMDVSTEREILKYLYSLRDLTLVIVSHRVPSLRQCSKIIFVNKKTIDAEGSFSSLVRKSKDFRELVNQFKHNQ